MKKVIAFHQNRNCLLNNIVLQKLGIFYGLSSFNRTDVEKVKKDEKSVRNFYSFFHLLLQHTNFLCYNKLILMNETSF